MDKANYIMIGGFLGAGKTTAILKMAQFLKDRGMRVGLITNDQSTGLVDTTILGAHGFPVEEITGGCFCCKFNSLVEASERLSSVTRPDAFIAEPVGSCTDLKATVSYPLRRIYGDDFRVAPLSVLVDPMRALRILGAEEGKPFSPKVLYVYRKQLEEAEVLVINKADLIDAGRLDRLALALAEVNPDAEQFVVSARHGDGLTAWFERIAGAELGRAAAPDVDYDLYAEGEALLGWLNCTYRVTALGDAFDGNRLLQDLAGRIQALLATCGFEVAHLKMTLTPDEAGGDIGVCNLVRNESRAEQSHALREPLAGGTLIVNLRAEADPDELLTAGVASVAGAAEAVGAHAELEHQEHFRPARPVPTHRMAAL
jgi:Ni2+-binding GTPase involved in maturation of urease and hydrogenase